MLWIISVSLPEAYIKAVLRNKPSNAHLIKVPRSSAYSPYMDVGGYGYLILSNQDGDPVTFNYVDISGTGTPVGAGDDWCSGSDAGTLYYLGFSFPFYDQTRDSISICSNGTVILENTSTYIGLSNTSLPDTIRAGFVAVMWDDLNPTASGADDIYFQSFSSCPDGYSGACAVVQYNNVPRFGGSVFMNFEVIFYDNGNIKLQYNSAVDYNDATVGMQDSTAATGTNPDWYVQYVYGGIPDNHVPDSGTAILIRFVPVQTNDVLVFDVNPDELIPVSPVSVTAQVFNADTLPITGFTFHVDVYDTVTNTVVFSADTSVDLSPRNINTVTFSAFTPSDRMYYRAVVYVTDSRDPDPTYDTSQTRFRTHVRVGDVLGTFSLRVDPLLGQNFWFITYNPTYQRYFISDYYGGVYSFDPGDPAGTFRMETWAFAPVYDPYLNHPFGIATDNDSLFFLGHLEYDGWYVYGEALASYREVSPGVFAWTGDSLDLFSIAAAITYGMDYQTGTRDALWLVMSDGTAHAATLINPTTGTVRKNVPLTGLLDIPTGISYLPYTGELLLTDGKKVYRVDTMGNIVDAYYTPGNLPLYDLDVYEACSGGSTNPVVAYAVTPGDTLNTVHIVATGYYCDEVISVAERPKVEKEKVSLYVSGRTVRLRGADGVAYVYDLAGRRVGTFRASETFTFNRSGVFFVKAEDRVFKVVVR